MTGLFGLALPIARVDLLRQQLHVMKGVWFPYMSNLVLELLRQPIVEMAPEGTFTITAYLAHVVVELDDILGDPSDMDKLSKRCSASPTGSWGPKFTRSS